MTNPHPSFIRQDAARVVRAAAQACGISYAELMSPRRTAELAEARFVAMLVLHRANWSYPNIAIATGRNDHTTCLHGVRQAQRLIAEDPGFAAAVGSVERQLLQES